MYFVQKAIGNIDVVKKERIGKLEILERARSLRREKRLSFNWKIFRSQVSGS